MDDFDDGDDFGDFGEYLGGEYFDDEDDFPGGDVLLLAF